MIWTAIAIVCCIVHAVCIRAQVHLYHQNTADYALWNARGFLRLRRRNVAWIVYSCFGMAVSAILVLFNVHILRLGA